MVFTYWTSLPVNPFFLYFTTFHFLMFPLSHSVNSQKKTVSCARLFLSGRGIPVVEKPEPCMEKTSAISQSHGFRIRIGKKFVNLSDGSDFYHLWKLVMSATKISVNPSVAATCTTCTGHRDRSECWATQYPSLIISTRCDSSYMTIYRCDRCHVMVPITEMIA